MALPNRRDRGIRTYNEQGALNALLGQLGLDVMGAGNDGDTNNFVAGSGNPTLIGVIDEGGIFAAGDVTLTVDDGTAFTDDTHIIILGDGETPTTLADGSLTIVGEIVKVTNIAGNNLTVTRGVGGSADAAHADGAAIYQLDGIPHDGLNGTELVRQWVEVFAVEAVATVTVDNRLGDDLDTIDLLEGRANGIPVTAVAILVNGLAIAIRG